MALKYPAESTTNTFFMIKAFNIKGASVSNIKAGKVSKATYSLEHSFFLPLPVSGLVDGYQLTFEDAKTAGMDMNVGGIVTNALKSTAEMTGVADAISMYSGRTVDPNVTPLFKGIQLRTMSLAWEFMPRSRKDSENLSDIIDKIRWSVKPGVEGDPTSSVLTFPCAFGLGVVINGKSDPKTLPSLKGPGGSGYPNWVCTGINVSYNGGGHWYNFDNGEPTSVSLSMEFKEMVKSNRGQV